MNTATLVMSGDGIIPSWRILATLVIVLGSWKLGAAAAHPDTQAFAIFGFVFAARCSSHAR